MTKRILNEEDLSNPFLLEIDSETESFYDQLGELTSQDIKPQGLVTWDSPGHSEPSRLVTSDVDTTDNTDKPLAEISIVDAANGTPVHKVDFSWPTISEGSFSAKGGNSGEDKGGSGGGRNGGNDGNTTPLLETYVTGDANVDDSQEFNIHLEFSGSWTAEQQEIVTWAADYLSTLIVGDARDDTDLNLNPVDDIVISMSTGRIDGSGNPLFGNVLAETQIIAVRDPSSVDEWLPVTSSIKLDSRDLKASVSEGWSGDWDAIVLHEMLHAIGFAGVIFDGLNLTDGAGNFIGANATAAYGGVVPIEGDGGLGTAGSHWDETAFAPNNVSMPNEVSTGYIGTNEETYFSDTTLGALADLGYEVQDPSPETSFVVVDSGLYLV